MKIIDELHEYKSDELKALLERYKDLLDEAWEVFKKQIRIDIRTILNSPLFREYRKAYLMNQNNYRKLHGVPMKRTIRKR
jgi:hypothetical protein